MRKALLECVSKYYFRVLYQPKTPSTNQVFGKNLPNTRMILKGNHTSTWFPKTNRVHISNEDCDDIGNGVFINRAYDGEKAGVLL